MLWEQFVSQSILHQAVCIMRASQKQKSRIAEEQHRLQLQDAATARAPPQPELAQATVAKSILDAVPAPTAALRSALVATSAGGGGAGGTGGSGSGRLSGSRHGPKPKARC